MTKFNGNTMTLKHFQDFYFLEALQAGITMAQANDESLSFRKAFTRLQEDVNTTFERLTKSMALHIYSYLWYAALGEAYYAKDNCKEYYFEEADEFDGTTWVRYSPTVEENVELIKNVFGQHWSSSAYGGDAWLDIVEGMDLYGTIPDAAFIDHAVDLEHNGGNVFDKTSDGETCGLDCYDNGFTSGKLRSFLNHKFAFDILNVKMDEWGTNYNRISRKVYELIVRFSNIVREVKAVNFLEIGYDFLTDFEVFWGEDEFTFCEPNGGLRCDNCGEYMDEDDACYTPNDNYYCEDCFNRNFEKCAGCRETYENDEIVVNGYCKECAEERNYAECEDCCEWTDEWHNIEGSVYCHDCATQHGDYCEECDEWYVDIDGHNENEHDVEPKKEELFPLFFDADGVLEITETTDNEPMYDIRKVEIMRNDFHKYEVVSVVYDVPETKDLIILDTETFDAHERKYKGISNKHFYSITHVQTGASIMNSKTKYDLSAAFKIVKAIYNAIAWNEIKDKNDIDNVSQEDLSKIVTLSTEALW